MKRRWQEAGAGESPYVTLDVAKKFKETNAQLDRDMGAGILGYIQKTPKPELLPLDIDFAADSLFCEWAYVVDLDHDVLEVYKGFNQKPLAPEERFAFLEPKSHVDRRGADQYHPIRLVAKFSFAELQMDTMEKLEKRLDTEEEKAEATKTETSKQLAFQGTAQAIMQKTKEK